MKATVLARRAKPRPPRKLWQVLEGLAWGVAIGVCFVVAFMVAWP